MPLRLEAHSYGDNRLLSFFERNLKRLNVEFAARISIADDRPKTRDEENSGFSDVALHLPLSYG